MKPKLNLKEYNRVKADHDARQREADRAAGAMAQLKQRLLEDFGCETVKQAQQKLSELSKEMKKAIAAYETAQEAYKKEFGKRVGAS